jgi:hypothetical protein
VLSDKRPDRKSPKPRKVTDERKYYSDSQKLEAVKTWLILGNLRQTAAALNIKQVTLDSWRYSDWWDPLVAEIRAENSIKLSQKLKKIYERALDVSMDRLENGDWIYDQKTGEMRRKPVALKDAHKVAVELIKEAQVAERKPIDEANQNKTTAILQDLASKFAEFAKQRKPVEVTDVIYMDQTDALHDERETGLQEGIEVGEHESPPQIEGPSPQTQSTEGV